MPEQRLLIAYAHPDDESFGSGGLIAKCVGEGILVDYICATNGDMGTIPDSLAGQYDKVSDIRLRELDCAADVLGLNQVIRFDYKDSGMMGSESSNDPDCLWYQWQNHPETVIRRVVDVIRETKPQVIITFNRYGGYGHPDHIAIQRATTEAFKLAGDATYTDSSFAPYAPQKLYYASIPGRSLKFYLWMLRLQGKDVRRLGVNKDLDFQAVIDHLEPVHTVIDLNGYMDAWDKASQCHVSQGQGRGSGTRGLMAILPVSIRHKMSSKYGLTRIYPEPSADRVDEYDLFANVRV